ncbi:MAG: hypothetical protein QXD51_04390 [Candidatus Anstonellales archaeon]
MLTVKFGTIKECKNEKYSFSHPAYAFPFEENPIFPSNLNLKNVLTIASGGGIPMLMLLEKGASRVDVVDISFDAVFLAFLRLCAASLKKHKEFSEFLISRGEDGRILSELYKNFPDQFKILSPYGIHPYFVIRDTIFPSGRIPDFYLREFDLPSEAEITFIVSDISEIKSGNYTTIFLSNVLSYAIGTMHDFISTINNHASVLYTIADQPGTFLLQGREFKERFLPYTKPKHF